MSHWKAGHKQDCAQGHKKQSVQPSVQYWQPRTGLNASIIFEPLPDGQPPMLPCYGGEGCHGATSLASAFERFRNLATALDDDVSKISSEICESHKVSEVNKAS